MAHRNQGREQVEELKDRLGDPYTWRNSLAILTLVAFILPWAYLDGMSSSHSGGELIGHLIAGTERLDMLQRSPLGFLTLFLIPPIMLILSLLAFWKTWIGAQPLMSHLVLFVLPIPMLVFADTLTSTDRRVFSALMTPQAGIIIIMLAQAVSVALYLYLESRGLPSIRPRRSSRPDYDDDDDDDDDDGMVTFITRPPNPTPRPEPRPASRTAPRPQPRNTASISSGRPAQRRPDSTRRRDSRRHSS